MKPVAGDAKAGDMVALWAKVRYVTKTTVGLTIFNQTEPMNFSVMKDFPVDRITHRPIRIGDVVKANGSFADVLAVHGDNAWIKYRPESEMGGIIKEPYTESVSALVLIEESES